MINQLQRGCPGCKDIALGSILLEDETLAFSNLQTLKSAFLQGSCDLDQVAVDLFGLRRVAHAWKTASNTVT